MINTVCALGSRWLQDKKRESHESLEEAKAAENQALVDRGRMLLNA